MNNPTPAAKVDGRTKAGRAARLSVAEPLRRDIDDNQETVTRAGAAPPRSTRQPVRTTATREPDREPERRGAMVGTGRDGEVLTRRHTSVGDIFHVPQEEIPRGWSYQWNTYTVHNQLATDQQVLMHANGWRPVPANRHEGRWTQPGEKGAIIVKGMRLEERPESLTEEAAAEDVKKARTQMRDQTDSLRLTEKLPKGFEANRKYRGTGGDVRISIDRDLSEIPRPRHEIEE